MSPNIGTVDRSLRIGIGLTLVVATLLNQIGLWGWIGLLPLATGIYRVCPAYLPFGLSTCSVKPGKSPTEG